MHHRSTDYLIAESRLVNNLTRDKIGQLLTNAAAWVYCILSEAGSEEAQEKLFSTMMKTLSFICWDFECKALDYMAALKPAGETHVTL